MVTRFHNKRLTEEEISCSILKIEFDKKFKDLSVATEYDYDFNNSTISVKKLNKTLKRIKKGKK